jgi:cyanophycinase
MVIDQHFSNRNRMGRLLSVLARHPDMVGVGVDEQTAAVIQGESLSVVGVAGVWVCLPASGPLPVRTQRLGSGDQIDLGGLGQTLIERSRTRDAERISALSKWTDTRRPLR